MWFHLECPANGINKWIFLNALPPSLSLSRSLRGGNRALKWRRHRCGLKRTNGTLQKSIHWEKCSVQVTVMGCQTTSKVLYQRIISTPDLLWRKIFHSINVAVSPAGELLLNNRWTLRKEQHWTMWFLTFKERTQVHSRRCQIGSEAALERIAQLISTFSCFVLSLLKHHGPKVTERSYFCWIFI